MRNGCDVQTSNKLIISIHYLRSILYVFMNITRDERTYSVRSSKEYSLLLFQTGNSCWEFKSLLDITAKQFHRKFSPILPTIEPTLAQSIDTFLKTFSTSCQKLTSNHALRNGWQRMRRRAHQYQIRNRPRVGVSKKAASSLDLLLSTLVSRFNDIDRLSSPTLHPRFLL